MIRYFAGHPTAANLLMIAFIVIGVISVPTLQRETFPRVEPRRVEVNVVYPAARPEEVEEAICQRIEDAVDGINNVDEITCDAREGLGRAVVKMVEGSDLDRFFADVKTEVEAIDDFPEEIERPTVRQLGQTDFVASVAVTGPGSLPDLKAYAEELKERMLRWGGIPKINIQGFSDHQIRIELKDAVLRQFGLSVSDIANSIRRQSLDLPAGSLESADGDLLLRFAGERKRAHEFLDLVVVSSALGGEIRLGQIATITDRFDLAEEKIVFNGKPAALLEVTKTENEDTLNVIGAVTAFLDHERQVAPPGVEMIVTNDISSIVQDRLNLLLKNGTQGLVLVAVTLWLFFGLRFSFWVAAGLPISFLGAIFLMYLGGYSINMLTMVALLMVIGILMDDAIVIAENVATERAKGKPPLEAAVDGARDVVPSIAASFITTAFIFGSLAFLKGDIGAVLKVVPVVMLFVLAVSLIEAFLILPAHLHHSMEHGGGRTGRIQARVEAGIAWARERIVGRFADLCVQWRYLTVGCAVALLLLAVSMLAGGILKFSPFPELEGNVVQVRVLLPQGTPLKRTEAVVARLDGALATLNGELTPLQPEGRALVKNVAFQFNKNQDANEAGAHVATVTVDLLNAEIRSTSIDEFIERWRALVGDLPDVISMKYGEPSVGPAGLAIEVRLKGPDLDRLKQASTDLQDWFGRYRGVINLQDDLRPGKPELRMDLKPGASSLGLDARTIADQVRTAFFGTTVSEVQVGGEDYEIDVRLAASDRDSLADIDYFTISAGEDHLVPISAVADIEFTRGYARINRVDGVRTVTVQGDVDTRIANGSEIMADANARYFPELRAKYPDVTIALEGQNKEAGTAQASMVTGFLVGLIGVYLLLSFLFRSYIEPVVVMVVIPFALIGVLFGHVALGLDFTMPSMLGFISLAGIVVNDSILLVNFIKHHHETVKSVTEAAPLAARARFRAIFLTSVTTVVGLMPMLFETSLQAQVLVPLVASIAFGMTASTLLVLFLVPAVYSILDDMKLATLSD